MLRAEARLGLRDLDLEVALAVEPGRCLALVGPSGAGKTTLLRVLAGLRRPDAGRVLCAGETWLDTEARVDLPAEGRRVAYLAQDPALFPHMSAWRNVAYPLRGLPRAERRRRALALLGRLGVRDLADARPRSLSGGERRRVALARALAREPRAILLDEPFASLDPRTRGAAVGQVAAALREAGAPALLVTHDFEEAAVLGDVVGVLEGGRLAQVGSPARLAAEPASAFVAGLTGATVLRGTASPGPDGLTAVALEGGGTAFSAEQASGPVAVALYPWEIAVEPESQATAATSVRNRLAAEVVSLAPVGNRVRVGLAAPQPLAAEITAAATQALGLAPGARVVATWKAAATRLVPT